jgi:hypothetical protein
MRGVDESTEEIWNGIHQIRTFTQGLSTFYSSLAMHLFCQEFLIHPLRRVW